MEAVPRLLRILVCVALLSALALPTAAGARPIAKRTWLTGVTLTEYFPVPERWFSGRLVSAPGLAGRHRVDWLYSASGLLMEGDGVGLDGRRYHVERSPRPAWVDSHARPTKPSARGWTRGWPAWSGAGFWLGAQHTITYPLARGGWSHGRGLRAAGSRGSLFGEGPSLPLRYYHSVAVDPRLIPMGSRIYIPAYRRHGGGWFVAQDTGGAIMGRHLDVYRPAPASASDGGEMFTRQRILVVPPRR
jgi:3D (Asp-Asp-Asp) domain-containing protein